ncbi:unnamed protein product [Vitrella brassicaformis CCMP3155]|uniref:Uncharacterized protein n=1 Tax=Vitrella brassicaformis (strain CCMP3155) TaxID=1169540 RepID=A0A0G4FTL2_VITBC|nr:unnamed protein product [Vitrella brassicaformis CCMP3155]|eukprot:CEM17699.1 unnamed protein product [Vitrella brassicaformis CCMP3155]
MWFFALDGVFSLPVRIDIPPCDQQMAAAARGGTVRGCARLSFGSGYLYLGHGGMNGAAADLSYCLQSMFPALPVGLFTLDELEVLHIE